MAKKLQFISPTVVEVPPDPAAVQVAMAEQEKRVKARQSAERKATTPKPKASRPEVTAADLKEHAADVAAYETSKRSKRTSPKAEPSDIRAFLDGLGLSNKQAAEALGKSAALIATVRSEKGDRWSRERWAKAKPVFAAYAKRHKIAAPSK